LSASQHRADNMDRPVLLVDPGGRLRHANAPACALFGEHLEPGRPLADLLTGLDLTRAPISPVQVELRAPAPRQPAQAWLCATELDGEPVTLVELILSLPGRGEADANRFLREHADRITLTTEESGIGLFDREILESDAPPPWWSVSMRRMLGYPPDVDADPLWFFERVHEDDKERMSAAIEAAERPEGTGRVEVEVRWRHPRGEIRHLLIRSSAFYRENGSARSVGIVMDVTDQRLLEVQIRQMQKMEAIGRLAGGVAHDFNNLLSVILTACELTLADLGPDHPNVGDLQDAVVAAERAASLTGQLLAFGRKQILQPTVLTLDDVVREVKPIVERLIEDTISLRIFLSPDPLPVLVDRTQLTQVLLNLILNARDAIHGGGTIIVETLPTWLEGDGPAERLGVAPGAYAVLTVSDDGVGMDADTRRQIFEPFFTTKPERSGTGLGLATVYGIVRQSGGAIWVYSEIGMGTTFKIYLPAADAPVPEPSRITPVFEEVVELSGRVLLVEDDPLVRDIVRRVLLRAGLEVYDAPDPEAALAVHDDLDEPLDLLLTDVLMPGMTGRDLADLLVERQPDLPVLFMSGYTEQAIVHHGVLHDDVEFMPKPVTPARLLATVSRLLAERAGRD